MDAMIKSWHDGRERANTKKPARRCLTASDGEASMAMLAKAVNAPADVPLETMHRALPFRHAMARPWHPFRGLSMQAVRQVFRNTPPCREGRAWMP
ncbi:MULTISPECIES: hypothetical protein [unclassified Pannonibacter]|uniref:hypothetical protein n=1 Tax=unclassified Pannonibacter TaxID=2627228 RepID=UPI0016478A02|nr:MULTISPECIES: hypothetical protein [unclassified Pannonibacter]